MLVFRLKHSNNIVGFEIDNQLITEGVASIFPKDGEYIYSECALGIVDDVVLS